MRRTYLVAVVIVLAFATLERTAIAEPYTLEEDLNSLQINFREYPDANGVRWATAEGQLGNETQYLHVDGISMRSASTAFLLTMGTDEQGKSEQATLVLAKDSWVDNLRQCTTDDSGKCSVNFRTFGEAGFKITGNEATSWQLIVLTGPELPIDAVLPSPLYAAERSEGGAPAVSSATKGEGSKLWIGVVAVLLLVAIALLLVLIRKNRGAVVVLVLICFGLLSPVQDSEAATGSATETDDESVEEMDMRLRESAEGAREEADLRRIREREARRAAAGKAYKDIKKQIEVLMKLKDLAKEYGDLTSCSKVESSRDTPRIPSFCEDDGMCQECYRSARGEFDRVRGVFQQLQKIYQCSKTFSDKALSVGDSTSSIHAVTGLAWQVERRKIVGSVDSLKEAYDEKFLELSDKLHDSMIEMSVCEAYYGEPDWYDRFGYMYFEFVQDKYKRAD